MNQRVAIYYSIPGILLFGVAIWLQPHALILIWPGISCLLVAVAYLGLGGSLYGKRGGRLPRWSWCVYLFILLGHELSRRHYARQCSPWDELLPGLLIGRKLNEKEADKLMDEGVGAVLDLTAEFTEPTVLRSLHYLNLPILDLTAPSPEELELATSFISTHIQNSKVYVHCKIGYSRTAAVAGYYLLKSGRASTPEEAMHMLRAARPSIVIRPEAEAVLKRA